METVKIIEMSKILRTANWWNINRNNVWLFNEALATVALNECERVGVTQWKIKKIKYLDQMKRRK